MALRRIRGFTLIELLVVISIISLLSAVVLNVTRSAREKARIAGGRQFSASLRHVLGADAILVAGLDEGSGTTARDSSGHSRHGTVVNATWSNETQNGLGYSLIFNGASSRVNFPKIDRDIADKVTISAWIYPNDVTGNYEGIGGNVTSGGFYMFIRDGQLWCDITTNNGRILEAGGFLRSDVWQHAACIYDGANMRWIIDGRETRRRPHTGTVTQSTQSIMGYSNYSTEYFDGLIDSLEIFANAPGK